MLLLGIAFPALGSAAVIRNPEPFSPLTGAGSGVTFLRPSAVAIDESTGNVFVADGSTANAVKILNGTGGGNPPVGLKPNGSGEYKITGVTFPGINPAAIAFDNSGSSAHGTLYVFQPGKILKFTRDPITEQYVPAGEILVAGTNTPAGLTVDSSGNIWLGDFQSRSIRAWNPAGTLIQGPFDMEGTPTNAGDGLAVDNAGDLFVLRAAGIGVYEYPANGTGGIDISNPKPVIVEGGVAANRSFGIAYDPATNRLAVALKGALIEYDATSLAPIETRPFGEGIVGNNTLERVAVNSATERLYVADRTVGKNNIAVFGPPVTVPTTVATSATNVIGTKATLNGSVNPEGLAVTECIFQWGATTGYGNTAPCEGSLSVDSAPHPVSAEITGLTSNGTTYHYRVVAKNANGTEFSDDKTLVTADTVATGIAMAVGDTTATLNGLVRPEGLQYTACKFEYGLTTSASFEHEVTCNPSAAQIDPDFAAHAVSAVVGNLQPNSTYRFRLVAANSSGTLAGNEVAFTTVGPSQITEVRARDATQNSATLEATIDPRGFGGAYYFEWGSTPSYGNRVPADFELPIGGTEPLHVNVQIAGLLPGASYHYRVVATSNAGTTRSPDHLLQTLNSCALPDQRCFELVSPRDVGPVARPGATSSTPLELHFQAATAPGSLAYVVESGFPNATRGAEVLYHGTRNADGWDYSQLSAPVIARNELGGQSSNPGMTLGISPDLSCTVLESGQPLTLDATGRLVSEAGGTNLYRRNPNGSFTLITSLPPENPEQGASLPSHYDLAGFSNDCSKVFFTTAYKYPGVATGATVTGDRLYEWANGQLRGAGFVPGPSGEVPVGASPGGTTPGGGGGNNNLRTVSADGSRLFFRAARQTSSIPAEIGKTGVFVRENGVTRDVSHSETAIPDTGANYQYASVDGSRVFFTANAGLTAVSSAAGTDLYEYNLNSGALTDRSVGLDAGGAQVAAVLGASEDGSTVYFAARGQLLPGKGQTLAGNEAADTFSVYRNTSGVLDYVGVVGERDLQKVPVGSKPSDTSRVSTDGRFLLFESVANVTGYQGGDKVAEFYLYDAAANAERTVCISCRQDGNPSVTPNGNGPIFARDNTTPLYQLRNLVVRNGQPLVFFTSFDRLATGAVENRTNIYQWSHDQIFHIGTEPAGIAGPHREIDTGVFLAEETIRIVGASSDGTDLYLVTPESLTWEDGDQRSSVYDARIGGGFKQPPARSPECDPMSESTGACQTGTPGGGPTSSPGSSTFSGPGNVKPKKAAKHHKKHKKHGKKKHKKKHGKKKHANGKKTHANGKKKQGKTKSSRHANGNRRAGK